MEWKNTLECLNDFGRELVERYKDTLEQEDLNATYNLYNSVEYYIGLEDSAMQVELHLEEYWYYLENGRKAGKWPPLKAIKQWVLAKPILPRRDNKIPKPEQLAFLIARKIGEEGTEGQHPLENTLNGIMETFKDRIEDAITRDVMNNLDEILVKL